MSKTIYYRQCRMQKKNSYQVSYIPEEFAIMNKVLKLRENGEWNDGWVVIEVSSFRHADDEEWNDGWVVVEVSSFRHADDDLTDYH